VKVVEDGYEFFADRHLVTVFSAPNYGDEFDNSGAIMTVDENLVCSFQILQANSKVAAPAETTSYTISGYNSPPQDGSPPMEKQPLESFFIIKDSTQSNPVKRAYWARLKDHKIMLWKESQKRFVHSKEIEKLPPFGIINLHHALYIELSEKEENTIIVALQNVTYHLRADSQQQVIRWLEELIRGTCPNGNNSAYALLVVSIIHQ
jgi:hypothetical protein